MNKNWWSVAICSKLMQNISMAMGRHLPEPQRCPKRPSGKRLQFAIVNGHRNIYPLLNMGIFHGYVNVYQRVLHCEHASLSMSWCVLPIRYAVWKACFWGKPMLPLWYFPSTFWTHYISTIFKEAPTIAPSIDVLPRRANFCSLKSGSEAFSDLGWDNCLCKCEQNTGENPMGTWILECCPSCVWCLT